MVKPVDSKLPLTTFVIVDKATAKPGTTMASVAEANRDASNRSFTHTMNHVDLTLAVPALVRVWRAFSAFRIDASRRSSRACH